MTGKHKDPNEKLLKGQDDLRGDYHRHIPKDKLKHGSLNGKKCIKLSDGKTEVWVKKGKPEAPVKDRYEDVIRGINRTLHDSED